MNTARLADPGCYGCLGTGRLIGFGHSGEPCPCVHLCAHCDRPIARTDDWNDGTPPRCDCGMPACADCCAYEQATEPLMDEARLACDFNDGARCTAEPTTIGLDKTGVVAAVVCDHHSDMLASDSDKHDWHWIEDPLTVAGHLAVEARS